MSIRGITSVTVASPDPVATSAAWDRLGVALPVDVVPVGEGGSAGLAEVGLAVDDVPGTAALLVRRGLDVEGDVVSIAGVRWRLTEARSDEGVNSPPSSLTLDHVVVSAADATRATADYGARLGLDLRLDRDTGFGFRGMFFRCGDVIVEVVVRREGDRRDAFEGLAWRSADLPAERDRLVEPGVEVSEIRAGRKPGTVVATVRDRDLRVPKLLVGPA